MPIYEYSCTACGKKFEAIRSIKDSDTTISCKFCNSQQTQRTISLCYTHGTGGFPVGSTAAASASSGGCGGCSGGSCGSCHQ